MSDRELLYLKIRSLIVDREMVTATANHDLTRFGEWRCDYSAWHSNLAEEIQDLIAKLDEDDTCELAAAIAKRRS